MGCPDRAVMKSGCGGALIQNMNLARELIAAVKNGVKAFHIPVSVKTRLGFSKIETDTWIRFLLEQGLDALTVHARTVRELSKVSAHWDEIGTIVKLRDSLGVSTKIIGNGDVMNAKDAYRKYEQYGVDGVMIGRGIFDNLWAFDRSPVPHIATQKELFAIMKRHIALFEKEWGSAKNYSTLKKYFKMYIKGFDGASVVRDRVMQTTDASQALAIIEEIGF